MVTKKNITKPNHNKDSISSQQTIDGITLPRRKKSQKSTLGSIAKFASHAQQNNKNKRDEATIKRFKLQKVAAKLLPTKRVSNCQRLLVPNAQQVDVYHMPEGHSAHYKNLRTCDSVWDCPVCAAKITEHRRAELQKAVQEATNHDLTPILVTFTLQHDKGDKLADLLNALKNGYRKFKSGRAYQDLKADFGIEGTITSTEVTNGFMREKNNGWHPHLHALMFILPHTTESLQSLEDKIKARWTNVLQSLGYDASWLHGVTVKTTDREIVQYIAKFGHEPKKGGWTVERELTKAPVKKAHDDGTTPFGLLEAYEAGNEAAGRLFKEYSSVFHGRAQLVWSRGLRDLLKVGEEKSDEEVNAVEEEGAQLLTSLTRYTWFKLTRLATDARGELLCIAATGDVDKFHKRVIELVGADASSPPPKKKEEKVSVAHMCGKCLGVATLAGAARDVKTGRFYYVMECPTCGAITRDFNAVPQTERQVVELEIAIETAIFPAKEAAIEEQLRLPLKHAYTGGD